MKIAPCMCLFIAGLAFGCTSPGVPKIIGRSTAWYETTDPDRFYSRERKRGARYFIGIRDPALDNLPGKPLGYSYLLGRFPGASNNLLNRGLTSWVSAPVHAKPAERKRFLDAVERFALRYNPHVTLELQASHITPEEIFKAARDHTKGTSDVCPVHNVKMKARYVPTVDFDARYDMDLRLTVQKNFPFARENISVGWGLFYDPRSPKAGKIFVCPQCVAGMHDWISGKWMTRRNPMRL